MSSIEELQKLSPDFSSRICKGLTIDDLDTEAIENMRKLIADKQKRSDENTIPLKQLLSDLLLMNEEGNLKYAALLLLGKSEAINQYLPQANVVIEYRNSRSQVRYGARQEYRLPLTISGKVTLNQAIRRAIPNYWKWGLFRKTRISAMSFLLVICNLSPM